MSAISVLNDVRPADSGIPIPKSGSQGISSKEELMQMEFDTTGEIPNLEDMQNMEVDTAVWRNSATNYNAGKRTTDERM